MKTRIFTACFLPFFLILGAVLAIRYGWLIASVTAAISSIIFCVLFIGFSRLIGKQQGLTAYGESTLEINLPIDRAILLCKESTRNIKKSKVKQEGKDGLTVITGITSGSWGEKIVFNFRSNNNIVSEINVISKPRIATNFIDFGKNKDNIEKIVSYFKQTKV